MILLRHWLYQVIQQLSALPGLEVQDFYLLEQLRENSQMSWGGRLEQHVDRQAVIKINIYIYRNVLETNIKPSAFMKCVRRHDLREGLHLESVLTQKLLEIDRHGVGQVVKHGHLATRQACSASPHEPKKTQLLKKVF